MIRDFQSIIDQMRKNGTYHFRLYVKQDFQEILLVSTLESSKDKEKDPLDPDQAISLLNDTVAYYEKDPNALFSIELYKTPTSGGAGKTGKIKFVQDTNSYRPGGTPPQGQGPAQIPDAYINGLGQISQQTTNLMEERLGHIQKVNADNLELNNQKNDLKLERLEFEREKKAFYEDKELTMQQIKELEKKYTSRSAQLQEGFEKGFENILLGFMKSNGVLGIGAGALSGAEQETKPEERTEAETIIEDVAAHVHESIPDVYELKVWRMITHTFIHEPHHVAFADFREQVKKVM